MIYNEDTRKKKKIRKSARAFQGGEREGVCCDERVLSP